MDFDLELIARLLLAALLGGFIGLEREVHGRAAGFRTHLLVSLGSCLFVVASIHFYRIYGNPGAAGPTGVDPSRVAAQVVTGIGFLGAGAIIRDRASIRGLTTAACLWIASAIGLACGIGLYVIAPLVTILSILALLVLKKIENRIPRDFYSCVKVWCDDLDGQIHVIERLLGVYHLQMLNASVEKDIEKKEIFVMFEIKLSTREVAYQVLDSIAATPGIKKVHIE